MTIVYDYCLRIIGQGISSFHLDVLEAVNMKTKRSIHAKEHFRNLKLCVAMQ